MISWTSGALYGNLLFGSCAGHVWDHIRDLAGERLRVLCRRRYRRPALLSGSRDPCEKAILSPSHISLFSRSDTLSLQYADALFLWAVYGGDAWLHEVSCPILWCRNSGWSLLTLSEARDAIFTSIGASRAVAGVVFSFCLCRPFACIYLFFIPVGIPAVLYALVYVAYSMYAMRGPGAGIAHEAHLGGALGGIVLALLLDPRAFSIFLGNFQ